jgi:eukaryotic-like serine/threonine-protein kinase
VSVQVDQRVTEVGDAEVVDVTPHPLAAVLGVAGLLLVVVLGVIGLSALMGGNEESTPVPDVVVPRMASRSMADAQAELERLGLLVEVRFEPNEVVPPGVVVGQEPIAGARLEVGEQVVLLVSDGPVGVGVPDLRGGQASEAERVLSVLGLEVALREVHDEDVPMGQIVRSDPAAGSRAVPGSTVTLEISLGPEPRTVPDVVGRVAHEAFAMIGRADLEVAGVRVRVVDDERIGKVLETDPPAGSAVPRDQPIEVTVGSLTGPVDLPDVVGLSSSTASRALAGVGLRVTVRTEPVAVGDPRAGRVIRQEPVVGTPLPAGAAVTIFVGAVPAPPPAPTTTVTAPAPPG